MLNTLPGALRWILGNIILIVGRFLYYPVTALIILVLHFPIWVITGASVIEWWLKTTSRLGEKVRHYST